MKPTQILAMIGCVFFLAWGTSCNRSNQFKNDQVYYSDGTGYYNAGKGKTATERLEQLGQPKKKVFVLGFHNTTPIQYRSLGPFAADELKRGLFLSQRVIVPTDVQTSRVTADYLDGENVQVAQLIREGRRLGVSVLAIGRIAKIVFRQKGDDVGLLRQTQSLAAVDVEMKIFDVASGREVMAIGRSGEVATNSLTALETANLSGDEYREEMTKFAIRDAMVKLVPSVIRAIEKMSWEGRIAKILGNRYYLNSGKRSGLVNGDILKVLTKGDDVYDPVTSAYLGRTDGQLKGTLEVVDFLSGDAAVTTLHTGGNFVEGDVVRLY